MSKKTNKGHHRAGVRNRTPGPTTQKPYSRKWKDLEDYFFRLDDRYGYCWCGCGGQTSISKETSASPGTREGEPVAFLKGHSSSVDRKKPGVHVRLLGLAEVWEFCEVEEGPLSTPCFVWSHQSVLGYPFLKRPAASGKQNDRRNISLRRVLYQEYHNVDLGRDWHVKSLCDNLKCLEPEHLESVYCYESIGGDSVDRRTNTRSTECL